MDRAEQFAQQFLNETLENTGFREPPLVDPDHLPPPGVMPPPPRAPEPESVDVPFEWPKPAAPAPQAEPVPDLLVLGNQGTYRGQAALLSDSDKAAIGRIVLEAAARVIRDALREAQAAAPRRRRNAPAEATPEAPKRKRGRPRKVQPEEVASA